MTAANGVDVLPMLSRFVTALNANDLAGIQSAVADLATAHHQLTSARGDAGAMYAVLDEADQARGAFEDHMKTRVAALVETDVIGAAGELAQRSSALSAAQAVTAKLAALLSPNR
jgi:flagellin-like hook-associated protein FlgL